MKKLIFLSVIVLISCSNPNSNQAKTKQTETPAPNRNINKSLEKSLSKKWELGYINLYAVTNVDDMEESVSRILSNKDSILSDYSVDFKSSGSIVVNGREAGKWNLNDQEVELLGTTEDGDPLPLNAIYRIDALTDWQLSLKRRFYDRNGNVQLRMEYVFFDYKKRRENELIDFDL